MSKIKLNCMKCGKQIKLDLTTALAICRKCQRKKSHKVHVRSEGIL